MGKQQQAPPSRRGPAMSAPQPPRKRKKKGRPSLLDLQKRSLRLEQQLLQEQQQQPQGRRGTRRNPGSADDEDDDDEGPASGSGRREKKLRLVMGLHDGSAKLPDYHDIIKHPMDFSTIRKKLDKGAYSNLEQFEARGIQEIAKKDFENLRQDSDASEPEPEPEPKQEPEPEPEEPKPQPRRGRPPNKNNAKQKIGRPPADWATADFSGATLATAANSGRQAQPDLDLLREYVDYQNGEEANSDGR
nr:unnamed protein product [Digitaria exilis]